MKIIILGAGQVGASLATHLASEENDITIVDQEAKLLEQLQNQLDLRCIHGYAAHPDVLAKAGAEDADMLIAVTQSDETNMMACQIAYRLFSTPTKIARVRAAEYMDYPELFSNTVIPIDMLISPEQLVTNEILGLLKYPGSLQVLDFADGKIQLTAVKALPEGILVGRELKHLKEDLGGNEVQIAAIYRQNKAIKIAGDTVIMAGDEVFFIAATEHIAKMMLELRKKERNYKRIIIAGGGNIGVRLAKALESKYRIRIIEQNEARALMISENLQHAIVLQGSALDEQLLISENIAEVDIFCAVTNDDEANMLSAMIAKRLGARKVMALINRTSYIDLIQSGPIDIAISPQQATIGALLSHIRLGDIVQVYSLRRGAAEAIEAVAHGDERSSRVVGKRIYEIKLPKGTSIGAIIRDGEVIMAEKQKFIRANDHVILFLRDKKYIKEVEKLFQVKIAFL